MRWFFGKQKSQADEWDNETDPMRLFRLMLRPDTPRDTFRLLYARLIKQRIPGIHLTATEPFALHFKSKDGTDYTLHLENLRIQCRDNPDEGFATIERYLANVEALGKKILLQRDQIVPQVKDQEFLEHLGTDAQAKFPLQHLAGDLWVTYWVDEGHSLRTVSLRDLAESGIKADELSALAIANLRCKLPDVERHGDEPWFLLTAGGDFTASLLLLPEIWNALVESVDGDLVASAPTRDVLLVTGSQSSDGLRDIRQRAIQLVETGDHVVSATLLRRDGEDWKVFD